MQWAKEEWAKIHLQRFKNPHFQLLQMLDGRCRHNQLLGLWMITLLSRARLLLGLVVKQILLINHIFSFSRLQLCFFLLSFFYQCIPWVSIVQSDVSTPLATILFYKQMLKFLFTWSFNSDHF